MSVWLHRLDFHIKCYITMILKKTIAFPCYQEPLLVDSAWPCPPPGFSGLMLSLFKSLLLTFQMFLFSLPQKPISLYVIKKSILAMSFASFRAFISKKIHEGTQIIKGLSIPSVRAKLLRRLRGISEAWGSSVSSAVSTQGTVGTFSHWWESCHNLFIC